MRYLKIPQQCFINSKNRNIVNQVVYFYQLKMINEHGLFINGQVISTISKATDYKSANIWKKNRELINLGLLHKHKQGYRLSSYDKLFTLLGYDMSKNGHRKGSFKIHRIPFDKIRDIKSWIVKVDLHDNINEQIRKAFNNLLKDKRYQYTGKQLHCASLSQKKEILQSIANNTVQMVRFNDEAILYRQMDEAYGKSSNRIFCNPDVTLSLQGVCNVLGLTNTSSAYRIINRLVQFDLIKVQKRKLRVGNTSIDYNDYKEHYSDMYILKDGCLWRRLCNKIFF